MLPDNAELLQLINTYEKHHPDETESVDLFKKFVNRNQSKSVYSRSNFDGHFTASAFLVNKDGSHILFLKHKKLGKWLQPGGHIDETDKSIYLAALREIEEETGLKMTDLQLIDDSIFDLDAHAIPENPKKNEPAHVHYDIRFLFRVITESGMNVNKTEADELKWLQISELENLEGFFRIWKKLT